MTAARRPAFFRRLIRKRERWNGHELADMGTAFGLELAYDEGVVVGQGTPGPARPARAIGAWRTWFGRKPAA